MATGFNQPYQQPVYGQQVFDSSGRLQGYRSPSPNMQPQNNYGGGMGNGMTYGGGMMQPGMGNGMTYYPLGSATTMPVVTTIVEHGPPIILDENGKAYPPGYIPKQTAPGTHDLPMPGDTFREMWEKTKLDAKEALRQTVVGITGPLEEKVAEGIQRYVDEYKANVVPKAQEFGNNLAGNPGGTVRQLSNQASSAARQAPGAINRGATALGQGTRQVQDMAGSAARQAPGIAQSAANTAGGAASSFSSGYNGSSTPRIGGGATQQTPNSLTGWRLN